MNEIELFEQEQIKKLTAERAITEFSPGDTIRVNVRIKEGTRERIQGYEGVCIAKGGKALNQTFTVRKISYGEGVERVFPLLSPKIASIDLIRRGDVRRAKLYFLRNRRGKAARIAERTTGHGIDKTPKSNKKAKPAKAKPATADKKVAATG